MTADADATASSPKSSVDVQFGKLPSEVILSGVLSHLLESDCKVYLVITAHCCCGGYTSFPSIPTIARCASIAQRTAHRSVDRLEELGLVTIVRGGGLTHPNEYTLTTNPDALRNTVPEDKGCQQGGTVSEDKRCQIEVERVTTEGPKGDNRGAKGCHLGGSLKEEKKKRKSMTKRSTPKRKSKSTEEDIEEIYQSYPRKVAKAVAIKAIAKALGVISKRGTPDAVTWLLDRVQKFAASPAGRRGQYTPYLATWINGERYDDDEKQWTDANGGNQAAGPARPRAQAGKYDNI